ncbi:twin-arginine translocation pathway signal protein [Sorangium cellulosum]|uniref:Twin-arginine translocation pathway signal protein n=1 Tax=Sorangium cellulosum TaxID=56 RepID=A0A150RP61_SORCE|nr:twin-arginine translocation pathway signal protein [Sorangium cellulosum]KYF91075.1 twin-arginine translocation pathway signal protein [Sorangium cellulosum]
MTIDSHDRDPRSDASTPDAASPEGAAKRPRADKAAGRRAFMGVAGSLAVGGVLAGSPGVAQAARGRGIDDLLDGIGSLRRDPRVSPLDHELRLRALRVRVEAAVDQFEEPIAPHPDNGDEERYPNKIGTDTRGLPHDARGEVDRAAYRVASRAHASREWDDFEAIPLAGTRKLVSPIGTLAVSLIGTTPAQIGVPPAPALASAEKAAEAVEVYWKALLRDVPFESYADSSDVADAIEEIDRLSGYTGPRAGGRVTLETLFRGSVTYADPRDRSGRTAKHVVPPGVLDGPYISQFLLRDIPYGPQVLGGAIRTALPGNDFQTDYNEWLAVQNGHNPTRSIAYDPVRRYVSTGRDLAEYVHGGAASFWGAALLLGAARSANPSVPGGIAAPLSPTNPYLTSETQASAAATFSLAYLQGLLPFGTSRAIRAAYWQKWFVHRSVRPEAYGGLVHQRLANGREYPLHDDILGSLAVELTFDTFGSYLLPQAFPEGAPLHGSYPGGAAAIAGVNVTLLKAFFDEDHVIEDPFVPDPADPTRLVPYSGPPLTVGGELNKLATNASFGRNWAGIHWRTDAAASLALGEAVAISLLRDERRTFREPFDGFTFTRFDGTRITI